MTAPAGGTGELPSPHGMPSSHPAVRAGFSGKSSEGRDITRRRNSNHATPCHPRTHYLLRHPCRRGMVIQEVGRQDVVLMALIEINAEFKLILKALNRIADCLERAYPAP